MVNEPLALTRWSCTATTPGLVGHPHDLDAASLDWAPAMVPGTAAAAMRAAGRWSLDDDHDFDAEDWWFRCAFPSEADTGAWVLDFGGLATIADVWLNGHHILSSVNMYRAYRVEVGHLLQGGNDLVVRCAALRPLLAQRRPRPRWKTRLVLDQNLRWFRTSLLGRMPSWTPPVAPVGPWRSVTLRARPPVAVADVHLRPVLDGTDGRVEVVAQVVAPDIERLEVMLVVDGNRARLDQAKAGGSMTVTGQVTVPDVRPWWPCTHGDQPRYDVQLECRTADGDHVIDLGRTGFRTLRFTSQTEPELVVNDVPVFCRGGGWAPDPVTLSCEPGELRGTLEAVRAAGMNMVRVLGGTVYPTPEFYDLCDELGILVWQDLMFANMDYPVDDAGFEGEVGEEVRGALAPLAGRPCIASICGGSEVAQQATMMGQPVGPSARLFDQVLPDLVAAHLPDAPYWAHSPMGGTHPFTVDVGISHYYGIGGYRRPLADARMSGVRFATECLGMSHVPDPEAVDELLAGGGAVHDPVWKRRVFRDRGASWDSEDARDSYMGELFGVGPGDIRMRDPTRYLDLARATSAAVKVNDFTEWRRPTYPCPGALMFLLRDLWDGAGMGVIDVRGHPKAPYHPLRRVLSPAALLLCDEGLNGLDVWALNDGPKAIEGTVTLRAFSGEATTATAEIALDLAPRSSRRLRAEEAFGEFLDVTYAYRFGPPGVDCVAVEWRAEGALVARGVYYPSTGPVERSEIGLRGRAWQLPDGRYQLEITTERLARCVMLDAPGCSLSDNLFDLEPGGRVLLQASTARPLRVRLRALNSLDAASITMPGPAAIEEARDAVRA